MPMYRFLYFAILKIQITCWNSKLFKKICNIVSLIIILRFFRGQKGYSTHSVYIECLSLLNSFFKINILSYLILSYQSDSLRSASENKLTAGTAKWEVNMVFIQVIWLVRIGHSKRRALSVTKRNLFNPG